MRYQKKARLYCTLLYLGVEEPEDGEALLYPSTVFLGVEVPEDS